MRDGNDSARVYRPAFGNGGDGAGHNSLLKHKETLIRRMRLAAKARFNAHERLTAKADATNTALQMANLYTIALGIFVIQFKSTDLIKAVEDVLNYVSILASVFVQIIALIESFKDYGGRATAMHDCGLEVNHLMQRLELEESVNLPLLQYVNEQYNSVIKKTASNHNNIDYEGYLIREEIKQARGELGLKVTAEIQGGKRAHLPKISEKLPTELTRRYRWYLIRYHWNVYGLTAIIIVSPMCVLGLMLFLGVT